VDPADLLDIENKAAAALSEPVTSQLQAITQELARRYVLEFGSIYAREPDPAKLSALKSWLTGELAKVDTSHVNKALKKATTQAWKHGYESAHADLGLKVDKIPSPAVSEETYAAIKATRGEVEQRLKGAQKLVAGAQRWGDLTYVMAKANQAATTARSHATYVTNATSNDAVMHVALSQKNVLLCWFNERDSCIHCAAYAGLTVKPGKLFPGGLTYGDRAIRTEPFASPPLHHWCRCHLGIIRKDDLAVPAALKREAQRSIAKGFALPSESDKVRLKAVQKLLESDPKLPATVLNKARREIKSGIFKSRRLPTKK
jgi:hypothetical protein